MLLNVLELALKKASFEETFPPQSIDIRDTNFRQTKDLHITGEAQLLPGTNEIQIRGHVNGTLEGECDRCLATAPLVIDRDYDLFYRSASEDLDGTEKVLERDETEVGYYEGEELATKDVLQEQVLLWIPMHWVCKEDCKGICPACGVNRNREACKCQSEAADDRWSALRDFRPER